MCNCNKRKKVLSPEQVLAERAARIVAATAPEPMPMAPWDGTPIETQTVVEHASV